MHVNSAAVGQEFESFDAETLSMGLATWAMKLQCCIGWASAKQSNMVMTVFLTSHAKRAFSHKCQNET